MGAQGYSGRTIYPHIFEVKGGDKAALELTCMLCLDGGKVILIHLSCLRDNTEASKFRIRTNIYR